MKKVLALTFACTFALVLASVVGIHELDLTGKMLRCEVVSASRVEQ